MGLEFCCASIWAAKLRDGPFGQTVNDRKHVIPNSWSRHLFPGQ